MSYRHLRLSNFILYLLKNRRICLRKVVGVKLCRAIYCFSFSKGISHKSAQRRSSDNVFVINLRLPSYLVKKPSKGGLTLPLCACHIRGYPLYPGSSMPVLRITPNNVLDSLATVMTSSC